LSKTIQVARSGLGVTTAPLRDRRRAIDRARELAKHVAGHHHSAQLGRSCDMVPEASPTKPNRRHEYGQAQDCHLQYRMDDLALRR
jgi:hypothetical protein